MAMSAAGARGAHVARRVAPLFPYIPEGTSRMDIPARRLTPDMTLHLHDTMHQLAPSVLHTEHVAAHTSPDASPAAWSVLSVFSPYTDGAQVMVMETSATRYTPTPAHERVRAEDGRAVMQLCARVLAWMRARRQTRGGSLHVGWNCSPLFWGGEEEGKGFQSLRTKWHMHVFEWASAPEMVPEGALSAAQRRVLWANDYSVPLARMMAARIAATCGDAGSAWMCPRGEWTYDVHGLHVPLRGAHTVDELLRVPPFFEHVVRPVAVAVEALLDELTEAVSDVDVHAMRRVLSKTEQGPLSDEDRAFLRKAPTPKPRESVLATFAARGWPQELGTLLHDAVVKLSAREGAIEEWWCKCFAYAVTINATVDPHGDADAIELRVLPGVYCGANGLVESLGVIMERPLNRMMGEESARARSAQLWDLARTLRGESEL